MSVCITYNGICVLCYMKFKSWFRFIIFYRILFIFRETIGWHTNELFKKNII